MKSLPLLAFSPSKKFDIITETTKVYFKNLTDQEIEHYIEGIPIG